MPKGELASRRRPRSGARGARTPCARARAGAPRRRPRRTADRASAPSQNDLAEHGRVLQQLLLARPAGVEAGGDDALNRLGQRQLVGERQPPRRARTRGRAACGRTPRRRAGCRRPARAAPPAARPGARGWSSSAPTSCAVSLVGERRERDRSGIRLPPPQPARRSSSSGRAVQTTSSGTPRRPVGQMVDEVEQAVVGPVQILEHEDQGPLFGERLEEAAPGRESLVAAVAAVAVAGSRPTAGAGGASTQRARSARRRRRRPRVAASPRPPRRCRSRGCPACAFTISPSAQNVTPSP